MVQIRLINRVVVIGKAALIVDDRILLGTAFF